MAAISALTATFESGTVGDDATTANTGSTQNPSGAASMKIVSDAFAGSQALEVNCTVATQNGTLHYDFTAAASIWYGFAVKFKALPSSGYETIALIVSGSTTVTGVRIDPSGTWQIRDGNSSRWTASGSELAATGTWYEVRVFCDPGGTGRLKVYDGPTGALLADSGSVGMTSAAVTTVDNVHIGALAGSATIDMVFDRFLGDDSTEPGRLNTPSAVAANAGSDQSLTAGQGFTLTASATGGVPPYTYAWEAITGGAPTLSGSGATRTGTASSPATETTYTYQVTATDSAGATDTDTVDITVAAATGGGGGIPTGWVEVRMFTVGA